MKVVIAIDSFKGSLSSLEAGEAAKRGILKSNPQAQVEIRPLADGGEGTVEALVQGMGGRICKVTVTGPLGNPVEAEYGIVGENTAVIEMSAAAGITLVPDQMRNPLYTTTYGVGEMIKDAIEKGCRRFLVGIRHWVMSFWIRKARKCLWGPEDWNILNLSEMKRFFPS